MNSKNTSAIPFITFNEGIGFSLSKQAQQFLNSLPDDRQLGIISIVGKYRTGKSFFVNRVLLNQKKGGFQVGPTINPCTKGLWLWKKTISSTTQENMDVILIDTEGFGGMDENANHDSRIFLFSLLLSSYFIYNSVGSIDENALNTLNLIINLAKDIQTKTSKTQEQADNFPSFLWVVRDFTLQMVDKHENKINSKEYLENSLEFQKGNSDAVENKNKIRRLLKHFFHDRDCQVMYRPSENEKDLQRLDEMDNAQLRPEFLSQVETVRSKVFKKVKPKKINNTALNGRLLVTLCKGYMQAINKGMLPNVESAWFYVCRNQGLKAVQEVSCFLEEKIANLLKQPLKMNELGKIRAGLKQEAVGRFKKRSLGSEEGHPDLLERLEKRMDEQLGDLVKRSKAVWAEVYRQTAQKLTDLMRDKIYRDQYRDFLDFVHQFEKMKQQFDSTTRDGDSVEKWTHFNDLSEDLYRLAGETIATKVTKQLQDEKNILQHRIQIKEEEMQQQADRLENQNQFLKDRVGELEKQNAKLNSIVDSGQSRSTMIKGQHDKLYEKYKVICSEHEHTLIQLEKLKKENRRISESQMEQAKNEAHSIRCNLQKERTLFEMEKKYMEQELGRMKEKCSGLQSENRKLRAATAQSTSDYQDLEEKYEEKIQEMEVLEQTNAAYSKKIEHLLAENSRKNELMNDHSEWMLEKSYLQNQIAFLKNTLSENKRLHDALLVALQQSLSSTEGDDNHQLIQANKSLSEALQKSEARSKHLQDKYQKVREFKKLLKHCASMQCACCSKLISTSSFHLHLQQCVRPIDKENMQISVSQAIIRQSDQRKKPFTEYTVVIGMGERKWKVNKKYKEFTELQQSLLSKFPSIKYPPSCNFLVDINNLVSGKQKNTMAEERRTSLQQYLKDLSKMDQIRESEIFMNFLDVPGSMTKTKEYSKLIF